MTAWMISKYHLWKAAVSGASVDDWIADYGTADDSLSDVDLFHGSPFVGSNAAEWRRASAISYVGGVTTPVLILSDVGDNRDSFATSSMYWRALRDNHKDARCASGPSTDTSRATRPHGRRLSLLDRLYRAALQPVIALRRIRTALALAGACALIAASPLPLVRGEDFQKLVSLGSPTISPDGTKAALVVSRVVFDDDRYSSLLDLVDLGGGATQTLVSNLKVSRTQRSSDGTRLAFIANETIGESTHAQVYGCRRPAAKRRP